MCASVLRCECKQFSFSFTLHLVAAVGFFCVKGKTMEETAKALEAKLAQMEAKLAMKSESSASASASWSSSASSPEVHSALRIKPQA